MKAPSVEFKADIYNTAAFAMLFSHKAIALMQINGEPPTDLEILKYCLKGGAVITALIGGGIFYLRRKARSINLGKNERLADSPDAYSKEFANLPNATEVVENPSRKKNSQNDQAKAKVDYHVIMDDKAVFWNLKYSEGGGRQRRKYLEGLKREYQKKMNPIIEELILMKAEGHHIPDTGLNPWFVQRQNELIHLIVEMNEKMKNSE